MPAFSDATRRIAARRGAVVSAQSLSCAPRTARRDPLGVGGAGTQTRGRAARHVERRQGIPVAAFQVFRSPDVEIPQMAVRL
jgi:hypothetical protein